MGKSFQHLDLGDRATIQAQLTSGMCPGAIAIVLKRARSTITREMHRNGWMAKPRWAPLRAVTGLRRLIAERGFWQRNHDAGACLNLAMDSGGRCWSAFSKVSARYRLRAYWGVWRIQCGSLTKASTPHCMPCHVDTACQRAGPVAPPSHGAQSKLRRGAADPFPI